MDAKSESESSGAVTWGVIIGILALVGAGGAYMSGVFDDAPEDAVSQTDVAVQQSESNAPQQSQGAEEAPAAEAQVDEPEAVPSASEDVAEDQADAAQDEQPAEDVAATTPPSLDQIFVEPDGNAVLSGSADPGAVVRVLLDGETLHSFTVDDSGQFAEFVSIPFANTARGLALETDGEDQPVRSDDYLIAALPEPEIAVAEAEVASETDAQAETSAIPEEAVADSEVTDTGADTDVAALETDADAASETAEDQADTAPEGDQNQQIAILRSGEDGVELVQPATPQDTDPDQVALDTIGYSDEGEVELTGRVPDGSVVRLYLNNQLVADLPPTDDGKWRSELEDVDPGVYTLRVDEVGTDGTVVSRLETPFKREPLEVLQAANGDNGAPDQSDVAAIRSVTVQEGDTLWAISRERYGDGVLFVRLFEANRDSIRDPDLIYPGQVFTIPE